MRVKSRASRGAAVLACAAFLGACQAQYDNHGYIPPEEDLQQINIGADTKDTVAEKIGVPASSGVLSNSGYYYVRMRTRTLGPLEPKEIERQVVAISFSDTGVVQNVERFGLERGRMVPLTRRVTSSPVSNKSFLRQLLGNLGRFNPAGLGG